MLVRIVNQGLEGEVFLSFLVRLDEEIRPERFLKLFRLRCLLPVLKDDGDRRGRRRIESKEEDYGQQREQVVCPQK